MSKSLFGQLCAYLMSCDTHHRTCPRYLPKECSRQVSKKFEKYFSSYRADKHGHTDGQTDRRTDGRTDGQTDRQTDRRTDAGNDNTPPALGPRGENWPCHNMTISHKLITDIISYQGHFIVLYHSKSVLMTLHQRPAHLEIRNSMHVISSSRQTIMIIGSVAAVIRLME